MNSLEVRDNTTLYIFNEYIKFNNKELNYSDLNISIDMNDGSELLILDYANKINSKKIVINQHNNTIVNYYHSFKTTDTYKFTYLANISGNNNINNIKLRGVTSGVVLLDVDGIAIKGTKNNVLNEDMKVLNLGGKVTTKPMMHISTKEIFANHNTAISNINNEELHYLNSKGISDLKAIELIENGYLYGMFKPYQDFLELIIKKG